MFMLVLIWPISWASKLHQMALSSHLLSSSNSELQFHFHDLVSSLLNSLYRQLS